MILINDQWEFINGLDDIYRICREYINDEFADTVEEIVGSKIDHLEYEIERLQDKIDEIEGR